MKKFFKKRKDAQKDTSVYLQRVIDSFKNATFVGGYDDCIAEYLKVTKKKGFNESDAVAVVNSHEFANAFFDLQRYDIELTRQHGELSSVWDEEPCMEDDRFDVIYFDNYVYLKHLVDSLVNYRGKSYFKILSVEQLLCAEYSTMRNVGFVLHFIVNYAGEYDSVWHVLNEYVDSFNSEKACEFIKYVKEKIYGKQK